MEDSLRERLQTHLGPACTVERELGGGGMSRVFVATEVALGRRIVVKVLPPERAEATDVERFRSETRLAAQLQHPHIVPVLGADERGGLLFYTMPFVEGESLRARISRDGRLPVAEAVGLLREVADALAHAHARGIVHRDVKPDNVLLSDGHAMVVDFGIARALQESTASRRLTSSGVFVGTPAYMAPEQFGGPHALDHRADIYGFGALAYEMLAGRPPFDGESLAALIAAHVSDRPTPLAQLRSDLPPALATLVMQCLEKEPARRPQSAAEVREALASIGAGTMRRARGARSPRRAAVIAAALLLASTVAAGAYATAARWRARAPAHHIVVALLENETGDPSLDPLGRMAADWIAQGLSEVESFIVVDFGTAVSAAAQLDSASRADARAWGRETGAGTVITGAYYRAGDSLEFRTRLADARTGRLVVGATPVRATSADPAGALERLREQLVATAVAQLDPRTQAFDPRPARIPLRAAYEAYVRGIDEYLQGDYETAARWFGRSYTLDSTFLAPAVWEAQSRLHHALGGHDLSADRYAVADSVLLHLRRREGRLSPYERARLAAIEARRRWDFDGVHEALRRALAASPGAGDVRRDMAFSALRAQRYREAVDRFDALSQAPEFARAWPTLVMHRTIAYHMLGEYERELEIAVEARERGIDDEFRSHVEVRANAALGRAGPALAAVRLAADRRPTLSNGWGLVAMGDELGTHGHPSEAAAVYRMADEMGMRLLASDSSAWHWYLRSMTLSRLGRHREAMVHAARARALDSSITILANLATTAAFAGDSATALAVDSALAAEEGDRVGNATRDWYRPILRACIVASLGRREQALALLRQRIPMGVIVLEIHSDPCFRSLIAHPEFRRVLAARD